MTDDWQPWLDDPCSQCADLGRYSRDKDSYAIVSACESCGRPASPERVAEINAEEARHATGLNSQRCTTNISEAVFRDFWQRENRRRLGTNFGRTALEGIMVDYNNYVPRRFCEAPPRPELTDRDCLIAATVIQWLGTNCGRCFLTETLAEIKRREAVHAAKGLRPWDPWQPETPKAEVPDDV